MKKGPLLFLSLICLAGSLSALESRNPIQFQVTFPMEPVPGVENLKTYWTTSIPELVLERTQLILTGYLYGFRFEFIPSDRKRDRKEFFTMEPLAKIRPGDPRLTFGPQTYRDQSITYPITYDPVPAQRRYIKLWEAGITSEARGTGRWGTPDGWQDALEDSLREAVRLYLRERIPAKPRRITGKAAFRTAPYTTVSEGQYQVLTKVWLKDLSLQGEKNF